MEPTNKNNDMNGTIKTHGDFFPTQKTSLSRQTNAGLVRMVSFDDHEVPDLVREASFGSEIESYFQVASDHDLVVLAPSAVSSTASYDASSGWDCLAELPDTTKALKEAFAGMDVTDDKLCEMAMANLLAKQEREFLERMERRRNHIAALRHAQKSEQKERHHQESQRVAREVEQWFLQLTTARDNAYAKLVNRFLWTLGSRLVMGFFFQTHRLRQGGIYEAFQDAHHYIKEQCVDETATSGLMDWLQSNVFASQTAATAVEDASWRATIYATVKGATTSFYDAATTAFIPTSVSNMASRVSTDAAAAVSMAPCYAGHVMASMVMLMLAGLAYWFTKDLPQNIRMPLFAVVAVWSAGLPIAFVGISAAATFGLWIQAFFAYTKVVQKHKDVTPTASDLNKTYIALDWLVDLAGWLPCLGTAYYVVCEVLSQ